MIINKKIFLKMFRSGFNLIFFFLGIIIPNLVVCLNKDQDCTCTMNMVKKIVGGSERKLQGMAIVSLDSQNNYDGLTEREEKEMMIKDYLCSAFVLNEKWVMATRECTKDKNRKYTVGVGNNKIKMIKQGKIKVKNIIDRDGFEISLLELESPIDLKQFKPVCLDVDKEYEKSAIKNFIGAGFGKVSPQRKNLTSGKIENSTPERHITDIPYLKKIELIEDFKTCNNEVEMCVESAIKEKINDRDALCFGDEGGPLHYLSNGKTFVVGLLKQIFSYKEENGFAYFCDGDGKAAYLKIAPHIDWIKEKLGENNYCDNK